MSEYQCATCGKSHDGPPFAYFTTMPVYAESIAVQERRKRVKLGDEQCVVDREFFFVRGQLLIPVLDAPHKFCWGVWVSLSRTNFDRMRKVWRKRGREREEPYFGWLETALPYDPPTVNLKTMVHTQPVGERPLVELEPTEHPLAVEQRQGITLDRVREIAEHALHPS